MLILSVLTPALFFFFFHHSTSYHLVHSLNTLNVQHLYKVVSAAGELDIVGSIKWRRMWRQREKKKSVRWGGDTTVPCNLTWTLSSFLFPLHGFPLLISSYRVKKKKKEWSHKTTHLQQNQQQNTNASSVKYENSPREHNRKVPRACHTRARALIGCCVRSRRTARSCHMIGWNAVIWLAEKLSYETPSCQRKGV